jgi:hypothetical protein
MTSTEKSELKQDHAMEHDTSSVGSHSEMLSPQETVIAEQRFRQTSSVSSHERSLEEWRHVDAAIAHRIIV